MLPSSTPRPGSWYAVPQPYSRQAPGQQPSPPPGAPDFPPHLPSTSVGSCEYGSRHPSEHLQSSSHYTGYTYQQDAANRAVYRQHLPYPDHVQASRVHPGQTETGGQPAGSVHYRYEQTPMQQEHQRQHSWVPGHHSTHSQPVLSTYGRSPTSQPESTNPGAPRLVEPDVSMSGTPVMRPVSPRPQLLSDEPVDYSCPASVATEQSGMSYARRNTLPASISHSSPANRSTSPATHSSQAPSFQCQQSVPQQNYNHPQTRHSTVPGGTYPPPSSRNSVKRPLPAPPSGNLPTPPDTVASPDPSRPLSSASSAASPNLHHSPHLSRSSSSASSTSASSVGGSIRRPLPKPPTLPPVEDNAGPVKGKASDDSHVHRPARYAEAQAAVSHSRDGQPPMPLIAVGGEAPTSSEAVAEEMEGLSLKTARDATGSSTGSQQSGGNNTVPSIPSFSFDGPDGLDDKDSSQRTSGPSISISVAPPSPNLSKATSSDYFETALNDEGHPLPVSSVPMATATAKSTYAFACPGCGKPVLYGRTVNAMGKRWHPDCFVCSQCSTKLEHMEFFTKDGKAYCHVDYHEVSRGRSTDTRSRASCRSCPAQLTFPVHFALPLLPGSSSRYDAHTARRR